MSKDPKWLRKLRALVRAKPIVTFRISADDWWSITNSRRGESRFTIARPHEFFHGVSTPTLCLIYTDELGGGDLSFAGLLVRKDPVSTLETRATIEAVQPIVPVNELQLVAQIENRALRRLFEKKVEKAAQISRLSPALSEAVVSELSKDEANRRRLEEIVSALGPPRRYRGNASLQEDAVRTALKIFGLAPHEQAAIADVFENRLTALSRVRVLEDVIIEKDARSIPSFDLVDTDISGRALFRNGADLLEVYTANKRPLEECLGVDLIYLNVIKQNVVMVQYKMLTPDKKLRGGSDWIYRPDAQLAKEIARMKVFSQGGASAPNEYRLNEQVFYLRFVKRDGILGTTSITIPIDHYEVLIGNPVSKGPRGGIRVSYDSLNGRYMRQETFIDLVRSGYIGAHASSTRKLKRAIQSILEGERAVVVAAQFHRSQLN